MPGQHPPKESQARAESARSSADAPGLYREVRDLQRRLETTEDHWRRSAADLENVRKRFDRELQREQIAERERVLQVFVATLDDLERVSLASTQGVGFTDDGCSGLLVGIELILEHGIEQVAKLGYPRFGAVGDVFDPALHEIVGTLPHQVRPPQITSDRNNETLDQGGDRGARVVIAEVAKPGYGTPEQLLRPATVFVETGMGV